MKSVFRGTFKDEYTGRICNRDGYAFFHLTRHEQSKQVFMMLYAKGPLTTKELVTFFNEKRAVDRGWYSDLKQFEKMGFVKKLGRHPDTNSDIWTINY